MKLQKLIKNTAYILKYKALRIQNNFVTIRLFLADVDIVKKFSELQLFSFFSTLLKKFPFSFGTKVSCKRNNHDCEINVV